MSRSDGGGAGAGLSWVGVAFVGSSRETSGAGTLVVLGGRPRLGLGPLGGGTDRGRVKVAAVDGSVLVFARVMATRELI